MTIQPTSAAAEKPLHRVLPIPVTMPAGAGGERPMRTVRLTVNLPFDLVEQMRDAVYWTPGLTLAWMVAQAARTSLAELKAAHQGPFPRRLKPLRAGRPRLLGQSMKIQSPLIGQAGNALTDAIVRTQGLPNGHLK